VVPADSQRAADGVAAATGQFPRPDA
jgi:hypothetical protein